MSVAAKITDSGPAELREASLWTATAAEPRSRFARLEQDARFDVVVVGGGITGLSTALHLAEQGSRVAVLEAGEIPNGGSAYSVGLVNAGLWIAPDDILDALGPDDGERANRVLGEAPGLVFDLIDRYRIAADDRRAGTLHLGHNAKGATELARRAEQFQQRSAPVELLDAQAVKDRAGLSNIHGALLDRRAGTINPAGYARGLARAAAAQGAAIYTESKVIGVEQADRRWQIATERASLSAEHVVMATNAYTEDDWNAVKSRFFRGSFFQLATEPLHGAVAEAVLGEGQGAWDTRTVLSSIRRDIHGRLILGSLGSADGKPLAYLRAWANRIQRHYMPELGCLDWAYVWSGHIAFTPDHTLRLFEPAPKMYAVSGYNGRGITTGTAVGKGFADYILHGDDQALPLPIRPAEPVTYKTMRSSGYESGFTLYHGAQVMRILI